MQVSPALAVVAILALSACGESAGKPVVIVDYSPGFDSFCSVLRGGEIKDEWRDELKNRKSEFDRLWKVVGPELMKAAEEITGKAFPAEKTKARLTLCNLPSQSFVGISVNMRYALKSFTGSPVSMRYKVDTLFHELLHSLIEEHLVRNSTLLTEHAVESARVRNHLHLLALQKAVLLRLNDAAALKDVVDIDSQLPAGDYKRAWEIVNATDTEYLRFVAELK